MCWSQRLPNSACVGPSKSRLQKPLLVLEECMGCGLHVLCSGCDFRRSVCWVSKHTNPLENHNQAGEDRCIFSQGKGSLQCLHRMQHLGQPFQTSLAPPATIATQTSAGPAEDFEGLINRALSLFVLLPEQAVQETVDTDLYVRRRQHPSASRRYHEGHW